MDKISPFIKKQVPNITPEELEVLKAFAIELDGEIVFLTSTAINGNSLEFSDVLNSFKIKDSLFQTLT